MSFSDLLDGIDIARLLKLCIVHDLGEIYQGDVAAIDQKPDDGRRERERTDMQRLASMLPAPLAGEFIELWEEYDAGVSREAVLAKGFDKLETMLTHNQGRNPADFDYRFNLDYGRDRTDADQLVREIRRSVDAATLRRAEAQPNG
jgi:putative hydrolase of HD superfamily